MKVVEVRQVLIRLVTTYDNNKQNNETNINTFYSLISFKIKDVYF